MNLTVRPGVTGYYIANYPFKFAPSHLMDGRHELRYHAQLNPDYDELVYEVLATERVRACLQALAEFIIGRFVPWARSMTPAAAREQLRQFGSGRWDAGIWIEDYDRYLAGIKS